jgi:myo-inositol-1-phosphate synthase
MRRNSTAPSRARASHEDDDREHVAPSMCYAYAALTEGCPFIMGAPNTTVDIPPWELAEKTVIPSRQGFQDRSDAGEVGIRADSQGAQPRLNGGCSLPISLEPGRTGARRAANFHTKEVSKLSTLETILKKEEQRPLR